MDKNLPRMHQVSDSDVVDQTQEEISTKRKSRIVSRFLSPALQFWLKSQLEQVEKLEVHIEGGDRQIITGKIPLVSVAGSNVIFRGLHLTEVKLSATDIRINIGQIIKGKQLKVLESFSIFGRVKLLQSDFNASLKSALLTQAIVEFLTQLLPPDFIAYLKQPISLYDQKAEISKGHLSLLAKVMSKFDEKIAISLHTDLKLATSCKLLLENLNFQVLQKPNYEFSNTMKVDLGSDVKLQELTLEYGQLICQGSLIVKS